MNRSDLVKGITHYLTHLRMQVELLNSLNLQDDNVHAENFFRDLLNLALGYDLKNINIVKRNATAIDLGDVVERIAIQVTSTSAIEKIKHTHAGFVKGNLESQYDRLVILIIGEKKAYRATSLGGGGVFSLSIDDDVWGMQELLSKIGDLDVGGLELCRNFLRKELRIPEPHGSNEVNTLIRLIEVLSDAEEGLAPGDNREDPDPERKIHDRFAEHADFLKQLFVKEHELYGRALAEVKRQSDLSHIRVRKLQIHLMRWSDRILNRSCGDPQLGLETLTNEVLQMMGTADVAFDDGAVRYYLISELIACNVFPNKRSIDA